MKAGKAQEPELESWLQIFLSWVSLVSYFPSLSFGFIFWQMEPIIPF